MFVLGHGRCGAVKAAVRHIANRDSLPGAIDELVELVKPAVTRTAHQPGDKLHHAIRANVQMGVERLIGLEPILAPRVRAGRVTVGGGVYDVKRSQSRPLLVSQVIVIRGSAVSSLS